MNFDRSPIFSYLEEDNTQRAYFRVRPLLTIEGDIRQEAAKLWPNEGGLRIVPDRNEQHTFKVRMRELGSFCVVDLRDQPAEAGKIRTNKNYRPDRGEVNQYILYSDTVHPLPENTFYQLLDGESSDYAALAVKAITPLFYIREGDTFFGPVCKTAPAQPETAKETVGVLYELPCPDGELRLLLCMNDAPVKNVETIFEGTDSEGKPAAKNETDEPQDITAGSKDEIDVNKDNIPIGKPLQILNQDASTEETLKKLDKPVSSNANFLRQQIQPIATEQTPPPAAGDLSGTPLVRTPLHVSVQQSKNRTQEIVNSQWNVGKYVPPAQNLPNGTELRAVDNPVETACTALRTAWNASSTHEKLTDFILSLEGIRTVLEPKLCNGDHVTILQHVLRERLQDLEAERLTALCELDRAKRDVDAYKQELITALASKINRETAVLEEKRKHCETSVASLKTQINNLTLQRDALLDKVNELQRSTLPEAIARLTAEAQMTAPIAGSPLRMSPSAGVQTDAATLLQRLTDGFASSGISIDHNTAAAILVLLAICPRIGLSCNTTAPLSTLLRNIALCLGWQNGYAHQISAEQQPLIGARPVDSAPVLFTTSLPSFAPLVGATKLILGRSNSALTRNSAYDASQWPIIMVPALPFIPEVKLQATVPVSSVSLSVFAGKSSADEQELDQILSPVLNAAMPLSGAARKEMYLFVSICAGLMKGGLPVAADWGILLWIIPALERGSKQYPAIKALLDEYPISLSKL